MNNILEEYLVKLGFDSDEPSLRKLKGVMEDAEKAVEVHSSGILRWITAIPLGIAGAFTAISAAAVGVAEKASQADQSYRLLGLRMLMTAESARKLDMITRTLGVDLATIKWDKESHDRAVILAEDIDRMAQGLGTNFSSSMKGLRDIHFEVSRLGPAFEFLGMHIAKDLFAKLNIGGFKGDLKRFVDWFEDNLPRLSNQLTDFIVPVMKQTWEMAKVGGQVLKGLGWAFTELVGIFSKDESIRGAAFSFDHFSKAIGHVGEWFLHLTQQIPDGIKWIVVKFEEFMAWLPTFTAKIKTEFAAIKSSITSAIHDSADGLSHFSQAMSLLTSGKFSAASKEFGLMGKSFEKLSGELSGKKNTTDKPELSVQNKPKGLWGLLTTNPDKLTGENGYHLPRALAEYFTGLISTPAHGTYPEGVRKSLATGDQLVKEWWQKVKGLQWWGSADSATQAAISSSSTPSSAVGLAERMAAAIAKYEAGSKANPLSVRQNNPGNLREWGSFPVVGGYAQFPNWATGMAALIDQTRKNIARGLTLDEFFAGKSGSYPGFAAAKDNNNPAAYADTMSRWLGIDRGKPLQDVIPSNDSPVMKWLRESPDWMNQVPSWIPQAKTAPSGGPGASVDWRSAPRGPSWNTVLEGDWKDAMAQAQRPYMPSPSAPINHQKIEVGGISVYITEPGRSADEVRRDVMDGVLEALRRKTEESLAQLSPSFG